MTDELRAELVVIMVPTTRLEESVRFYRDAIGLELKVDRDPACLPIDSSPAQPTSLAVAQPGLG